MSAENLDNMAKPAESKPDEVHGDDTPSDKVGETRPAEIGGRDGPDPTRYGDWEKNGRCIDF